jgi:hypothetical protein
MGLLPMCAAAVEEKECEMFFMAILALLGLASHLSR